jgi:hypothetical protein
MTSLDDHMPSRTKTNMAEKFKQYQATMAQKRQRKAEKNKSYKGKERILPAKLTIQRLSAQVKGSSQKYATMGPLKRYAFKYILTCQPLRQILSIF